jgi:ABC-type transporter Mla subunit MlaD
MQALFSHLTGSVFIEVLSLISAALLFHFLWQYVFRGWRLRSQLKSIAIKIPALKSHARSTLRDNLNAVFAGTRAEHAWREFEETLHDQYELVGGERRISDVRATVPAEAFVNLETTVDPRIGAEYFRHLPGLFTGLGIVGTFSGLIQGLLGFDPNVDANALKHSLGELFGHVQGAFFFSALSIGLAMLVTLVEKWLYASCAKWLGEITTGLDSLFRAGVGEEYLSDLLKSSQENATQTRQLKESMVDDLKVLLTNLTERQIQATQQLSVDLGKHIEGSLKEPLASLAETVRQASGQQSMATSNVLENLMSAFMAQMRETVGGQLGDLSGLMQQTATSMTQVEAAMRALVGDMQRASTESTSGMQTAVRDLIQSMASHQHQQSEAISDTTAGLLERVEATISRLAEHQDSMAQRTQSSMSAVVGAMDARVSALTQANEQSAQATANVISSLSQVSSDAIAGMNQGAGAVTAAVNAVQQATERLARLTEQMGGVQSTLFQSAQQLTQSSGVLGGASQSLTTATGTLGTTASRLESVAQLASTEADTRTQLLNDLKAMTEQSRNAGLELASLSDEVRSALAENVDSFGNSVSKVLSQHLADYQKQLGDAVGMLRSAIEELAEVAVDAGT